MYRKRGFGKIKIRCQSCNKILLVYKCHLPRKKYCSVQCKNSAHKLRMTKKDMGGSIWKVCPICKKKFKTFKSLDSECCSNKCRHLMHGKKIKGEKHPLWTGGKKGWRGCDWKYIRQLILDRDGHKCQICGKSKRLHIHHVKPYRISQDNSLENLTTLCISCHMREERKGNYV